MWGCRPGLKVIDQDSIWTLWYSLAPTDQDGKSTIKGWWKRVISPWKTFRFPIDLPTFPVCFSSTKFLLNCKNFLERKISPWCKPKRNLGMMSLMSDHLEKEALWSHGIPPLGSGYLILNVSCMCGTHTWSSLCQFFKTRQV